MDVDRCVQLLKNASSDNEKMAALLLVAKLVKSGEVGTEERRKVFDAVGFTFINRLLTTQTPEGMLDNPYRKIALTILACFCTDPELTTHPQVTSKIPVFNEILTESPGDGDPGLVEDSLQCLQAIGASPSGLHHLLRYHSPQAVAMGYIRQGKGSQECKDLLLHMLSHRSLVQCYSDCVTEVLTVLSEEFKANQDTAKFDVCDTLCSVLALTGEVVSQSGPEASWQRNVAVGLSDILSSKLDPPRRNMALQLSATLCHLFGFEWAVEVKSQVQRPATLVKLLVHLATVETRLLLEDREVREVLKLSSSLSSCFTILEHSVVYISKCSEFVERDHQVSPSLGGLASETTPPLTQADLLNLHTALTEAFAAVVGFLYSLSELDHPDPSVLGHPVVVAAVRVLGAWLAEESLALSEQVYKLLPFLLKLCTGKFNLVPAQDEQATPALASNDVERNSEGDTAMDQPTSDLLKFLLPGLCHLTAEDKPRRVLLKAHIEEVLLEYMRELTLQAPLTEANGGQLSLCCGVLMNLCVCEPEAVGQSDVFPALAAFLATILSQGICLNPSLQLSVTLLFLMIVRRQGKII